MLSLKCGKKKFKIANMRVIGRPDFPTQNLLSRQHFEITESDGRIYVKDLKSANGTSLSGNRLQPNVPVELKPGDELQAGGLKFVIATGPDPILRNRTLVATGVFTSLLLLLLASPSMAFGKSIGWSGLALVLTTLAIPFAFSIYFFNQVEKHHEKTWALWIFGAALLISTFVMNDLLVNVIDGQTNLGEFLTKNKIQYFCSSNFKPHLCVQHITACPHCATRIEEKEREEIAQRLRFYFRQPASTR
jgi:hypothetical protein